MGSLGRGHGVGDETKDALHSPHIVGLLGSNTLKLQGTMSGLPPPWDDESSSSGSAGPCILGVSWPR